MREVLARPIKKTPALRGKSVCTLFFEPSTRTRASFEMAAKTMSADTSSLTVATSSVSKGETLKDTLLTMAAMGAQCFVIRHQSSGAPELAASYSGKFGYDFHIVNAGDGQHEHPTQGLLDLADDSPSQRRNRRFESDHHRRFAALARGAFAIFTDCLRWAPT